MNKHLFNYAALVGVAALALSSCSSAPSAESTSQSGATQNIALRLIDSEPLNDQELLDGVLACGPTGDAVPTVSLTNDQGTEIATAEITELGTMRDGACSTVQTIAAVPQSASYTATVTMPDGTTASGSAKGDPGALVLTIEVDAK